MKKLLMGLAVAVAVIGVQGETVSIRLTDAVQGVFYNGQVFDAHLSLRGFAQGSRQEVLLRHEKRLDPFKGCSSLDVISVRGPAGAISPAEFEHIDIVDGKALLGAAVSDAFTNEV